MTFEAPLHDQYVPADAWKLVLSGSVDDVRSYLDDGGASVYNMLSYNGDRVTPLYWASIYGNVEVVRFLVERGADINSITQYRMTPLVCVCRYGRRKEMIHTLLDLGADILTPHMLHTPLSWAITAGNIGMARCLLERGAHVDDGARGSAVFPGGYCTSPLFLSFRLADQSLAGIRLLLAHDAAFDLQIRLPWPSQQGTPLSYVRDLRTHGLEYYMDVSPTAPLLNALFDDFLTHYWTLRVQLRLFGRRANHPVGPQRLVLGDAYLPNKIGAFIVGDGIIVRGNKLC